MAACVTLSWDANPEPDISGYRLYYGTASHIYTQQIDVGNSTTTTVCSLAGGTDYFFAVTAYNTLGAESAFSIEVAYGIPGGSPTPTPPSSSTPTPIPGGVPVVTSLAIANNENGGQDLMALTNGSVVNLAGLPTQNINIQAFVSTSNGISQVAFLLDNFNHTEATAPYALCGDWDSCPANTLTVLGSHTLRVSAYDSTGTPGPTLIVAFSVINGPSSTPTPIPSPSITPTPLGQTTLANVSTRLFVQSSDSAMIGGFIVQGESPKKFILRVIGPSLSTLGVPDAMPDPALRLFDSSGSVIASNNNWRSDQSQIIQDTGLAPTDDAEAALVATLPPGSYTAEVNDATDTPGVALFEFYDLDPPSSQLINLSTRGTVQTQDRVMIGGFIINGEQPASFILRAIGPSLSQAGIPDALFDPALELYNGDGSLILQNDNWRSDQEQLILDSNLAPVDDRESAIFATLSPGPYSAVVRGTANSTGTALFEIYKLIP